MCLLINTAHVYGVMPCIYFVEEVHLQYFNTVVGHQEEHRVCKKIE